ncbi:MAG: hypothetical protein ACYDC2_06125, partial [Solirubrobacteraceae bacterium]
AAAGRLRFLRMIPAEALREQVRTPGQRLLGLRTVDRRTGERVALWRTLLLTGVAATGQQLTRRVAAPSQTPEQESERARFLDHVRDIHQRHPAGGIAREQEMEALWARQPDSLRSHLGRALGPALASALLTSRLRRRLAPTVEVRGRRAHSP